MKNSCAPGLTYEHGTCISIDDLKNFCHAFNEYILDANVEPRIVKKRINISDNKGSLYSQLKDRMKNMCGDDKCIFDFFVNVLRVESNQKYGILKPKGPEGRTEWLSNFDIEDIMKQYENVYKKFKFIGAVPADCGDHPRCDIHGFDYIGYHKKGIDYFGVVFNLDTYGMTGSHWVAFFIDVVNNEINYCDSAGGNPNKYIQSYIDSYIRYHEKIFGKKPIYKINTKKYQRDNTECGVYSCNFILRRLKGQSFEEVVEKYLSFEDINSCRMKYFDRLSERTINSEC